MKRTKSKLMTTGATAIRGPVQQSLFGNSTPAVPSVPSALEPLDQLKMLELDVFLGSLSAEQVAERAGELIRELAAEIDDKEEGLRAEHKETIDELNKDHAKEIECKDEEIKDLKAELKKLKKS